MKITKRRLKSIIREEYSRLKKRGLIRESRSNNPVINWIDKMMAGGGYGPGDVESLGMQLAQAFSADALFEAEEIAEYQGDDMYYAIIEEALMHM
tara:strand:+ start:520 stop:804 length:285 start_codon:yes stop_codon:yes gene_type:complete